MKRVSKIALIIVGAIVGVRILSFIIGAGIVIYQETHLGQRLNNPYINADFEGWRKITLGDNCDLAIPGEWELTEYEDRYLVQKNDETIAYLLYGKGYDNESKSLFEQILGTEISELHVELEVSGFTRIDAASLSKCVVNNKDIYYYLHILGVEYNDIVFVFCDAFESEKALIDYAQAITYYVERISPS